MASGAIGLYPLFMFLLVESRMPLWVRERQLEKP